MSKAKEQIRLERERLEAILEAMPSAVVIVETDGRFSYLNRRALDLYGIDYSGSDLEAHIAKVHALRPDGSPFPLEDMPVSYALKLGRETRNVEMSIQCADGTKIPVLVSAAPLLDAQGNVSAAVATFEDITDRKKAEEREEAERNRLYEVFETLPAMICLLTPDYHVAYANGAFKKRFGESEGRCCYEFCFNRSEPCEFCESFKVLQTGKPHHWQVTTEDGTTIEAYNAPFTDADGSPMVLEMDLDITERIRAEEALKKSEERYRHLIQYAPTGIYEVDFVNKRFKSVNDAMCQILGYSEKELLAMSPFDALDEESKRKFAERIRKALAGEEVDEAVEYRVKTKDGRELWASLNVSFTFKEGNVAGALVIAHDVTERKLVEERLAQANEEMSAILENIGNGFFSVDREWRFIYINEIAARNVGRKAEDLLGKSLWDEFPQIIGTNAEACYRKVMEERVTTTFEEHGVITGRFYEERVYPTPLGLAVYWNDITERKRTEEALKESEVKYRTLFESMTEAVAIEELIYDENGVARDYIFRDVNPTWERMFHKTKEEAVGRTAKELFGVVENYWIDTFVRVMETGKPEVIEQYSEAIDGFFNVNAWKMDEKTVAIGVINVTENKRAQRAASEAQKRFSIAKDAAKIGIYEYEMASGELNWDRRVRELFGVDATEPVTFDMFMSGVHPNDRKTVQEALDNALNPEWDGKLHVEYRSINRKDGLIRWIKATGIVFFENNSPMKLVGTVEDITERKEADEALALQASLIDLTPDAIIARRVDGTIIFWSEGAEKLYGWTKDEALGMTTHSLLSTEFPEPLDQILAKIEREGQWSGELRHLTKGGREVVVQSRWSAERGEQGDKFDILESNTDITERKKMEENLKRSNEELRQFAYVASHDLQEPLRMVSTYLGLLEHRHGDKLDGSAREYMEFAVQGAERMRELINDLLSFSRLDTQAKPFSATNMNDIADKARENLSASIETNHALVRADKLPTIMADEGQMVQLMQNLIGNAIKFHSDKPPEVRVSCQENWKEYIFSIQDNGIGIAAQYQDKIFEMFQRLHTREEYEGTGIGLAIAKRIVERHGGRIWVESDGKNGSVFYFTIPKRRHSS